MKYDDFPDHLKVDFMLKPSDFNDYDPKCDPGMPLWQTIAQMLIFGYFALTICAHLAMETWKWLFPGGSP